MCQQLDYLLKQLLHRYPIHRYMGGVPAESGIAVAVPSKALADASVVVTVTLQPGPVLEATVTQPVITQPVDG